ncbi:uncharacterized protein LOC111637567 [Centruroides sculpturatus]|uniref:uncharacterized protein LOC111637567 n=1 Tax=Centruroides sculpturatus TaxID=218467 RepID=UPI000C6D9801|nr:uncharacterized protein LOC111637567 [Centruroides sculpturatus]
MDLFPKNTQSNFMVKMSPPINLHGNWAVGLSEVIIPRNWFNISNHNNDYVVTFEEIIKEKDEPLPDKSYLVPLIPIKDKESKLFDGINENILSLTNSNLAEFIFDEDKQTVDVNIKDAHELHITVEHASKLLYMLNLPNEDIVLRENSTYNFRLSTKAYSNQFFTLVEKNRKKEVIKKTYRDEKIFIPIGLYSSPEKFLGIFKYIKLALLPNNKIILKVPSNISVEFGNELKDFLGFTTAKYPPGEYISHYPIEMSAGISEIFIYSNIISSHHVGDITAPLLRVTPVMGEKEDQIFRVYSTPLYFPVKKNYIDSIEIELRSAGGKEIVFFGGKTLLVLSFKQL